MQILLLVAVLGLGEARGQSDTLAAAPRWSEVVGHDLHTFWRAGLHLGSAPARWDFHDVAHAGIMIGLTGIASFGDNDGRETADRMRSTTADRVESVARQYGDVWVLTVLTGGTYVAGLVFEDTWLRETALLAGTSLLLTTAATRILKITIGRGRPYSTTDPRKFRMFSVADAYSSFPSGHAVAAFSISAVLAYRIDNDWATAGLYGLATLTALSRIYSYEHWFSDIVFGALFSTAMTRTLIRWYDGQDTATTTSGFRLVPTTGGIMVTYTF